MTYLYSQLMMKFYRNRNVISITIFKSKSWWNEGTDFGQITWWTVKNWWAIPHEISQKSRNSCWVSGGGVGAKSMATKVVNWRSPERRWKNVFSVTCIALSLIHLGTRILCFLSVVFTGSPGCLVGIHGTPNLNEPWMQMHVWNLNSKWYSETFFLNT